MFNTINEAIEYLKSLNGIIMPVDFTYLSHCTSCITTGVENHKKIWEELPKDRFRIYKAMTFTERDVRIISALENGGVTTAPVTYFRPEAPHLPFIIRVVIPKRYNNLNLSEPRQKDLEAIYVSNGEHVHPKLPIGTNIYMFAGATIDEVSGKEINILYGVRSQDVIVYANRVYEELQKQETYPYPQMPELEEIVLSEKTGNQITEKTHYAFVTDFEFNHHTYTIPKNKVLNRTQGKATPSNQEKMIVSQSGKKRK